MKMVQQIVSIEEYDESLDNKIFSRLKALWERNNKGMTRGGVMMNLFGISQRDISKSWKLWETDHRTKYHQVVRALEKLQSEDKIIVKKNKVPFGYFYKP